MPSKKEYINREISWLSFNQRVLQEAADETVPLLERLKFLGIFSSNLDEFYRVRVATHTRMMNAGIKKAMGDSPKKVLNQIQKVVLKLRDQFDEIFNDVLGKLEKENIFMINEVQLNTEQQAFVQKYFEQEVRPQLVPIMLEEKRKFPYMQNQIIYLAIHLSNSNKPDKVHYALIELPTKTIPRFIELPKLDEKNYIIMLDDIIRFALADIFAILDYDTFRAYTVKLTRDAEFDISDDITKSFYEKIAKSIKERQKGQVVRFVYDREMPDDMRDFLLTKTKMKDDENLISGGRYHNARDFMGFPTLGDKQLTFKKIPQLTHPGFTINKSIFESLKTKDILLHYPYHSYHYVIEFLREAAIDPKVKSIKITLYRLARNSNVINALINAMRNGKSVTVVIELQARFDEEANIHWANRLTEEGARILDGVPGLKVHAKLLQISRKESGKDVLYTYISTGNFNESTAKLYSDHGLFTSHVAVSKEVKRVFDFLENNYKTFAYKHLLVSPFFMRKKLARLIKNEIKIANQGKDAYIYIKLNNLVDKEMIGLLYQASSAGVKIKMLIRGICSLIPGLPGISENIEVYSILDKYLEHSRIIVFGNDGDEKYFLSSADWMIRNLDNRIEVATPVYDSEIQKELKNFLNIQFNDGQKARVIDKALENNYRKDREKLGERAQIAQYDFLKNELN
ncbi:MAG: polyphosphate kinase 1 [Calditrichaeota bacterium]|nr:MAG: polyphosphate kinase 1 [Calditrichota bacterium]MBL1204936.1 polyphosphate kinase 1 [Calditrichota bacterium]NOG44765.1 polyphosphate kinase 1 [Calditrichota bacterium]